MYTHIHAQTPSCVSSRFCFFKLVASLAVRLRSWLPSRKQPPSLALLRLMAMACLYNWLPVLALLV